MPAARYHLLYSRRITGRICPGKKNFLVADLLSLLVLAVVIIFLFFSPLSVTPSIVRPLNFFSPEGFRLDYLALIRQSLPGMFLKDDKVISGAGPAGSWLHLNNYPQLFLHNELAGFRVVDSKEAHLPYYYSGDRINEEGPVEFPTEREEAVSFLRDNNLPEVPRERPLVFLNDQPQVFIYHTHASESFVPLSGSAYSHRQEETVVRLGAYLAQLLEEEYGIPVMHHTEVYDSIRSNAYREARPEIAKILKQNPQIKVVVDLHRDGVSRQVTTGNIEGHSVGRILYVVGTRHSNWHSNLRFSLFLQNSMDEKYPGLSRGIRRYNFDYNQDLHPRSVLIEVGGHENTMEEALKTIPYLAEVLAGAFE